MIGAGDYASRAAVCITLIGAVWGLTMGVNRRLENSCEDSLVNAQV